jgi:hypothetical protein
MHTRYRPVPFLVAVAAGILTGALPLGLEPAGRWSLAIATWMVVAFLLDALNPMLVAFAGCFLFWASTAVGFDDAFAGFGTDVPWFLYGALILVSAARTTGVTRKLAAVLPAGSFAAAASVLVVLGLAAGVVIPSAAARAVILVLVALGLATKLDGAASISSRLPLVAVASYAAAVLGADGASTPAPPLAWRVLTVLVVAGVAAWYVRPAESPVRDEPRMADGSGRVGLLLALTALAWATTSLHGVSPALVGLLAGLLAVFPGFRPAGVEPQSDSLAVVVAGAAVTVPMVLVETKAAAVIAGALQGWVAATASWLPTAAVVYAGYVVAALFGPPATIAGGADATLAASTGLSAGALLWLATCASTAKLALYQSPALIIGASVGGFTTRDVLKFGVVLAIVGAIAALVLAPA